MKLVIADPKSGLSGQKELTQEEALLFIGKLIGEEVDASQLGLTNYRLKITGGTDVNGFPLKKGIEGSIKKRVLIESKDGVRRRKTVRGAQISADTMQVNTVIVKYGDVPIDSIIKKKEQKEDSKQ
ncbi:MAG: 30S ribosomal protein S6e [Candidatus Micrarchaeota archaeon]|nr:MAG: 30S ribosomal protein S6e [Candidatus Micrarchaeota archaeon]